MSDQPDPDHGELRRFVEWLDPAQAEMICGDLRDLNIPAVIRRHRKKVVDLETGEPVMVDTDEFRILVPDAFLDIATEVMDVTHLKKEGDASDAEILAELGVQQDEDPAQTPATAPPSRPATPSPVEPTATKPGMTLTQRVLVVLLVAFAAIAIGSLLGNWAR